MTEGQLSKLLNFSELDIGKGDWKLICEGKQTGRTYVKILNTSLVPTVGIHRIVLYSDLFPTCMNGIIPLPFLTFFFSPFTHSIVNN